MAIQEDLLVQSYRWVKGAMKTAFNWAASHKATVAFIILGILILVALNKVGPALAR